MFNPTPKDIVPVNRIPLVAGLLILLATTVVLMVKAQRSPQPSGGRQQVYHPEDLSAKPSQAGWFEEEKFKTIKLRPQFRRPTSREVEEEVISHQELESKRHQLQEAYAATEEIRALEAKASIDEKKLELQAGHSALSVAVPVVPGHEAAGKNGSAPKDMMDERLNTIVKMVKAAAPTRLSELGLTGGGYPQSDDNGQSEKLGFMLKREQNDDYLDSVKTMPRSPYELKAGSVIPAALITGINSDLPGHVNAQVTSNVYDSTTGNYLLIPQGSRLIGTYDSSLSFGQKRVQVVWTRILFIDGQSLDLDRMPGVDMSGNTGFQDKVDNHYLRIYGNAVLLSFMGAGYDALNKNAERTNDPRETVAAGVGQKLADISGRTMEKNMEVQPTLVIRPGYKFDVMVMKDMILEEIRHVERTPTDPEQT